jgi:hypothetical protein
MFRGVEYSGKVEACEFAVTSGDEAVIRITHRFLLIVMNMHK